MPDAFKDESPTLVSPATRVTTITPHDSNVLPLIGKALLVVSGGTVVLRATGDSQDETFPDLPPYSQLDLRVSHVRATGTTATHIKVLA